MHVYKYWYKNAHVLIHLPFASDCWLIDIDFHKKTKVEIIFGETALNHIC